MIEETTSPAQDAQDLALAANAIFTGASNSFKSRSGKPVIIKTATMKQVALITKFFNAVVASLDPEAVLALIQMYAERQKAAIAAGQDPHSISVTESDSLVKKAFGSVGLLGQLLMAVAEELPAFVAGFTNLTEAEYEALEPDEGLTLVGGIFMLNYGFFTRALPPILTAFMKSLAGRAQGK